ncbi:UNVERIFIED_CONTAM: hypothetical protein RMT77_003728 [Armadillidium vulgare]
MSVPESEIGENLLNGSISEEQNTTVEQGEIQLRKSDYVEPQKTDDVTLNNVEIETKLEASAEHIEEPISTTQVESEETQIRVTSQTEVHDENIQEFKDQEPLQNGAVNQESSEVKTERVQEESKSSEDSQSIFKKEGSSSSQIQDENLINKLHEIIQEISFEVSQDENEPRSHTWKPKGKYEVPKTEIKYEEIIPCKVPDVDIKEKSVVTEKESKTSKKSPKSGKFVPRSEETEEQTYSEEVKHQYSMDAQKILRHTVINGVPLSPQEIPIGIPLLAKILPKDESGDEEPREKITLERLFTPASDSENLIPLKKKRAFASSCFYSPDHPTIDDQVELAHKISTSLIDENNKSSKGQTMYMKRKNRSSKWIHEGGATQSREAWQQETIVQEDRKSSKGKPQLKLVLSPKKVQDFNAVQKHYEELMATSLESTRHITRMEVGKEIATHLESPTGKGAALFAKRKKRMDKFIVDEATIHQQQQHDQQQQQQQQQQNINEGVTSQQSNFTAEQNSTFLTSETNSIVHENGFQSNNDISFGGLNSTDQEAAMYKAEVTLVQKPHSASPSFDLSAPLHLHKIINDEDFAAKNEDRRKSFNLAPKGWGTYNNFYTPIHLEAK